MTEKPEVFVVQGTPKEDLLKLCSVTVIDPRVLATLFIIHFTEEITLEQEWKSFDLTISREVEGKHKVVLRDLFRVSPTEAKLTGLSSDSPTMNEVLFLTCMQFRLCHYGGTEYAEYTKELKSKMTNLGKNTPFQVHGLTSLAKYAGVTEDENLQRIIAGLDMFLMKAPSSEFRLLRMGTISMRLKDMGAWSAIKSMYSYVGDDARKQDYIFRWLFSAGIGEELRSMIEDTQETDKEDSYYPYSRSMSLVRSSFASVANNPNLHLIVHVVGTLKGHSRSGNAKYVPGAKEGPALRVGFWIAMGLDHARDMFMWYRNEDTNKDMDDFELSIEDNTTSEEKEDPDSSYVKGKGLGSSCSDLVAVSSDEESESEDDSPQDTKIPTNTQINEASRPEDVYKMGKRCGWQYPLPILKIFKERLAGMTFRKGTIGEWVQLTLKLKEDDNTVCMIVSSLP